MSDIIEQELQWNWVLGQAFCPFDNRNLCVWGSRKRTATVSVASVLWLWWSKTVLKSLLTLCGYLATKLWLETLLTWNHTTVTDISDICIKVNHIFHHVLSFETVSRIPVISTFSSCSAVLGKPHNFPVECHSQYSQCIYPWGPTQTWFAGALINLLDWQYVCVCGGLCHDR